MALFAALGTGLKVGGKVVGSIINRAKEKRAQKKAAKAAAKAAAAEKDLAAAGVGGVLARRLNLGPEKSYEGVFNEKVSFTPYNTVKAEAPKKINPMLIAAGLGALLLFFVFKRR